MPTEIMQVDQGLPNLARYSDTEAKLEAVQNYLFLLLENLRYILRNLSPENFNETELADWVGKNIKAETIISNTVITNELYSEYGAVADLTVDKLRTDYRRAQRYLNGDTSTMDYLTIHDEVIRFMTGEVLYDEDTEEPLTEQMEVDGHLFYWTDDTMTQMTREKVTPYPVIVYQYREYPKAKFEFEETPLPGGGTTMMPVLTMGAGNAQGHNIGQMYKDTEGLKLLYDVPDGRETIGLTAWGTGYLDLYGLRKPTLIDLAGWDAGVLSETLDGNIVNGFEIEFDENDRPILFTDDTGHETVVNWDPPEEEEEEE